MGKIVRFYQTEDGKTPVKDFLDSLPGKVAQKVLWVLMVAEELDTLPTTYFKNWSVLTISGSAGSDSAPTITGFSASIPVARYWCSRMGL